jgi:hypothetical protein
MNPKHIVCVVAIAVVASTAYAAIMLGTVTGEVVKYTDEPGVQCCDRISSPGGAAGDLMRACNAIGGNFFKNAKFSDSAYCGTHFAKPGAGWKYYCAKAVEAECYR